MKWKAMLKRKKRVVADLIRDRLRYALTYQAITYNKNTFAKNLLGEFLLINLGRDLLIEKRRKFHEQVTYIQKRVRSLSSVKFAKVEVLLI